MIQDIGGPRTARGLAQKTFCRFGGVDRSRLILVTVRLLAWRLQVRAFVVISIFLIYIFLPLLLMIHEIHLLQKEVV